VSATCPNGHLSGAEDFCDTCGAKIDGSQQAAASGSPEGEDQASSSEQTCPNCQTVNPLDALFCEACGYDFTTGALPRGAARAGTPEQSPPESAGSSLSLDPGHESGSPDAAGSTAPEGAGSDGAASAAPDGVAEPAGEAQTEAPQAQTEAPQAQTEAPQAHAEPGGAEAGAGAPVAAGANFSPDIPLEWVAEVWVDPDWYAGQDAEEPMPSPGLPSVVPLLHKSALIGRVSTSRNITPDIDCTSDTGVSRRHAQLSTDGRRWFVEDLGSSNGTFIGPASGPLPEDPIAVGPRTELDGDDRIYVGAWTRIVVRRATEDEVSAHAE
jgi:hypothetical protein